MALASQTISADVPHCRQPVPRRSPGLWTFPLGRARRSVENRRKWIGTFVQGRHLAYQSADPRSCIGVGECLGAGSSTSISILTVLFIATSIDGQCQHAK
jgi:hypothetical protein